MNFAEGHRLSFVSHHPESGRPAHSLSTKKMGKKEKSPTTTHRLSLLFFRTRRRRDRHETPLHDGRDLLPVSLFLRMHQETGTHRPARAQHVHRLDPAVHVSKPHEPTIASALENVAQRSEIGF